MNPNDMFLSKPVIPPPPPPIPSTSTSAFPPNGVHSSETTNGLNSMDLDVDPTSVAAPGEEIRPLTKKELEQQKKDLELGELLDMMDDWKPIIPDEVTEYYLQKSGFETDDVRVKRLLALAAQRFVSSISADAFQYARTRTAAGPGGRMGATTGVGGAATSGSSKKNKTRTVLTMEDLSAALKEYGVGAERAAYYL